MNWSYNSISITDIKQIPQETVGFIYETTHIPSGKKYIGKKSLYSTRNIPIGKKEMILLKAERKLKGLRGAAPKKKQVIKESDWKTYYGSQAEIKKLVKEGKAEDFKREILMFVNSKKLLTYYECKWLFEKNALESPDYINSNILGKFYRTDFK